MDNVRVHYLLNHQASTSSTPSTHLQQDMRIKLERPLKWTNTTPALTVVVDPRDGASIMIPQALLDRPVIDSIIDGKNDREQLSAAAKSWLDMLEVTN